MKNAILLFLSEIHLDKDKKLISTEYAAEGIGKVSCVQTNAAAVKFLMRKLAANGEALDTIFVFSTARTREPVSYRPGDGLPMQERPMQREIFEEDIQAEFPQLQGRVKYVEYNEMCQADATIDNVMGMVEAVRSQVAGSAGDWTLYTDLTGGMRHAAVLMMSVLHMLKYTGIRIGSAFYANYYRNNPEWNRIEDVSAIHKMFELVSSTDAFLNFASLEEIERYFDGVDERRKSRELHDLLAALRRFSDAVRVCRTGLFETSLQELAAALEAFKSYEGKSAQEKLFAQVLETLEQDYGDIISREVSRLAIIRWCIKKKFLQQAMTLFNEWLPRELVRLKMFCPGAQFRRAIAVACEKQNQGYKSLEMVFVHEFFATRAFLSGWSGSAIAVGESKKFLAPLRNFFKDCGIGTIGSPFAGEILDRLVYDINQVSVLRDRMEAGRLSVEQFRRDYSYLYRCICYKQQGDVCNKNMPFKQYFAKYVRNSESIYKMLYVAKSEFLHELLEIAPPAAKAKDTLEKRNGEESIAERWQKRKKAVQLMLSEGVAVSRLEEAEILSVLESLHWIRNQRNQINHAYDGEDVADSACLESRMLKTIECVERLGIV